jgi:hypothetical protein
MYSEELCLSPKSLLIVGEGRGSFERREERKKQRR